MERGFVDFNNAGVRLLVFNNDFNVDHDLEGVFRISVGIDLTRHNFRVFNGWTRWGSNRKRDGLVGTGSCGIDLFD